MNSIISFLKYAFILFLLLSGVSPSLAYDQVFPSVKLRYGEAYYFNDTFNNKTSYQTYLQKFSVSFTEGGDYNGGANPSFRWTSAIQDANYYIAPKTSVKVIETNPDYYFIKYIPVSRKADNLSIVYSLSYWEKQGSTWVDKGIHTEYQPYTITWCGDGIRDNYIDQYNGKTVQETCDPNDPAKVGWGTGVGGSCSATCQPINAPTPLCDSLSVNPTTGDAPLNSNFSCSGTNASSYQVKVTKSGNPVSTFNTQSGNYTFTTAGTYQVQCFVNGSITSPACTKTVTVNPTPPAPTCDSLSVNPQSGLTGLTSSFNCNGTSVSSYKVLIKKGSNTLQTFNVKSGSYSFTSSGTYQVQCFVDGSITSPACVKPVTVTDPLPKIYDLALTKKLVGSKTVFKQGDEVTFEIAVKNQGEVDATNIQVVDYIPNGFTLKGAIWDINGNKATLDVGTIPVGTTKINSITLIIGPSVVAGKIRNYAEISSDSGADCDSTPDSTNGNQTGETDATGMVNDAIGTACEPGGDEDDHDYAEITVEPTVVSIYDLALRKTLSATTPGPFSSGSTVTFTITVFNQGNVDANNIEITDYIPNGLMLSDTNWTQSGSIAKRTIAKILAGGSQAFNITFKIKANPPSTIINLAEISKDDGTDCDSTPDANAGNDGAVIDNAVGTGCEPGGDEDDHDPETITTTVPSVYDLALRKTLSTMTPGPFSTGSTVTFDITVFNQGNVDANGIQITDYIPAGLTLSDTNWVKTGNIAQRVIPTIAAGLSVKVSITFTIDATAANSITNLAEISSDDGNDCDSTPDTNPTNDGTITNDAIGTACEPGGDEDDHDPETIILTGITPIYDLALRKTLSSTTPGPFNSGSTVVFNIEVFNQGNVPANNIEVSDYIPTGLILNDTAWTQSGSIAKRTISRIEAGTSVPLTIRFTIAANPPSSITNLAEISSDDGNDCDSTPDTNAGNDGTPVDNAIGIGCESGGDEDDHDPETITTGTPPPVSACTNLSASATSAQNSLTSTLTCSGSGATNYKIEVKNPSGTIVETFNTNSGSITLPLIGGVTTNYTASCFVNGETTTPDICKKTLSVTPSGSSSGGPTPSCNDIIKNSAGNYTCYGNQYTDLFVMQCGTNTGGVVQYLGPTISIDSGEPGGRRIAQFSCAEPIIPRCFGALPGKSISQITDPLVWATSESCTIQTNPTCGDGVVHTGEECDMGINNGQPGYACSLTCSLPGGGGSNCGNGIKQGSEQCDLGSLNGDPGSGCSLTCTNGSSSGNPGCTKANGCISTTPNQGELLFGPVGDVIVGHNKNPVVEFNVKPYIYNNSDYDLSFDKLCIKKTLGDASITGTEQCIDLGNDMLYAYERIEFPTQPTFLSNKNAIPSGVAYGSGVLTTSVKDNNGIMHYASYFAAKLKVRVAKPAVTTVGGGTSYVKNTETTGDLQKVTSGVTGYDNNKNFVGSSVGTSGVSSYSQTVTNSGAIGKTETDTKYTQTVANTITGSTASSTTVNKFSTTDKYNGLSNVYIIKGKNVRISDISSLPGVTEATTYIVESGNLFIDINIISSKNIAFVVKGGNITIKNTVTHLDGTYISIPVGTTGGKILSSAETATQLVVNGSLYGDITDLVDDRYYIAKSSSGLLSVGTIVSFGSSIFNKPAPLVGQFIGEYLDSTKVAK